MSDQSLMAAAGVVAGYFPGVDILNGVDLELRQGELVGVIGPNGAGKSTLVKTIFGLVPVRSGTVSLRGNDISNVPAHRLVGMGVGYVPQRANVFPSLTVTDNLKMGLYQDLKSWDERLAKVTSLFPLLNDRGDQKAGYLSGGERQMVAIGRALMMDPAVLLLDEPSAGLAPLAQDQVFERVRKIVDSGVSVIMVEQNARRCLEIADRGYVLDQGRNAHTGPGRALLNDPKVIDLYLGTLGRAG
ncbi:MAG TPA: ABC transporter ATP-binding protein [Acidimicrobiia bacterium]|jgi:branched-chain amino acid transport system ATP-binding protein